MFSRIQARIWSGVECIMSYVAHPAKLVLLLMLINCCKMSTMPSTTEKRNTTNSSNVEGMCKIEHTADLVFPLTFGLGKIGTKCVALR